MLSVKRLPYFCLAAVFLILVFLSANVWALTPRSATSENPWSLFVKHFMDQKEQHAKFLVWTLIMVILQQMLFLGLYRGLNFHPSRAVRFALILTLILWYISFHFTYTPSNLADYKLWIFWAALLGLVMWLFFVSPSKPGYLRRG